VHPSQFQHLHAFKKQSLIQDVSEQSCLLAFNKKKFVLHNKVECIWCQMDGFDQTVNVKVIMATHRADTLGPALLCPGHLDPNIESPLPDRRQKRLIFQVCTAKMNLSEEVDLEDYVSRPDKISAAEVGSVWITSSIIFSITCLTDDMFCNYILSYFFVLF
jgi:AAA+ superfamily predicted ATPase